MTEPFPNCTLDLPEGDVESFLAVHLILLILAFSGNDSSTSYRAPDGCRRERKAAASDGANARAPAARGCSRGRSRKRSTVTCGSHGRPSRPVDAELLEPLVEPAGEPRRRRRTSSPSDEHADAARLAVAVDARSATARRRRPPRPSTSQIAGSSRGRPRAEEGERDVEVVRRDDPAAPELARLPLARAPRRRRPGAAGRGRGAAAHRLPRYRPRSHGFVTILCQKAPHEVERGDDRAAADRVAVAGEAEAARRGRRPASRRGRRRGRPASPPCRRPGPATPVTETATSAPSRSRAPLRHRLGDLGRDGAVLLDQLGRHAELALLTSFEYATTPPSDHVALARHGGQPGGDQPAGARLRGRERQAALAAAVEHELLDRPAVLE